MKREYIGTLVKISIFLILILSVALFIKPRYQALVIAVDPRIESIAMNSTCEEIKRAELVFGKQEMQELAEKECANKCNSIEKDYYYWKCNEEDNVATCYCR
ncbi:hypothetical protein HYV49_05840 [Candidatus Pacearchaeota archaeon]|nr:hypothetical protein [Candidatus Pacearchaeota archaeon]